MDSCWDMACSVGALGSAPWPVRGEGLLLSIAMLCILIISILAPSSSMPVLASNASTAMSTTRAEHFVLHQSPDLKLGTEVPSYNHDPFLLRRSAASASAEHPRLDISREEKSDNLRMHYNLEFARHIEISAGNTSLREKTRILCLVYTCSTRHERLEAIAETWGKKCTGFMAVSNQTDAKLGAMSVPHDGPEVYNNMWQKVRSMWKYVHEHFVDEFDFFYVCGDDNFVVNTHPQTRCHISTVIAPICPALGPPATFL